MELKILTLLTFVQALVSRAATSTQTGCLQHSNPNAACVHLDVSLNPLCSQNPAVCTGSQAVTAGSRRRCNKEEVSRSQSRVSSLVMIATRGKWCSGPATFFDIHTLWNKNDSDSSYKLILKDYYPENFRDSSVACIYDGDVHAATFSPHHAQPLLTQVQVVTQDIDQSIDMNTADVLVETSLSQAPEHTIYAVYNDSNGKSCEQHYTPLTVDEYRAAAAWKSDDELVQVNVSWCSQLESEEYIVAIGSDSCTMENRSVPCYLIRNSSSVSIGPFHWSRDSDIPVRVYSVATKCCPNAEAREELVHLFRGCGETCCLSTVTVPTPESATMATASGSGILTMSSQTSPCFLDNVPSSDDPDPVFTSSGSHSDVTNTSSAAPISVVQIKEWILIIVVSVPCTIFVAVLILLIVLATKYMLFSHSSSKSSKQQSMISQFKDSSIRTLEVIVDNGDRCNSSRESGKLLGSSSQESHVSTPTSIESTMPLFKDPAGSNQEPLSKDPVVLVVYSPSTPEMEQELIRCKFIPELQAYRVKVQSHDFACIKESPSQWLEREIAKATAVLCICNREFKNDWESRESSAHSLPLIPSLKHLVHATVQQNERLSKYVIVLLEPSDKDCIPTKYLQADPRQFSVNDIEDIARFVRGIPSHSMSSSSSE